MNLTRVQQSLLAVALLCIIGALAVGVYGRSVRRSTTSPVYTPPRAPSLPPTIVVHVVGAVSTPGLHTLPRGARIQDAVRAAGGFTAAADQQAVNLAAPIDDGQRIEIPELTPRPSTTPSGGSEPRTRLINLNTASAGELAELPGIGPELAARIVGHRLQYGPFRSVDALESVPGIGPKRLAQLRPHVTVR